MRKLPPKYTPLAFSFFMSMLMAFLMSGIVTLINVGPVDHFVRLWLGAFIKVWPIAFSLIFILRPVVNKLVSWVIQTP